MAERRTSSQQTWALVLNTYRLSRAHETEGESPPFPDQAGPARLAAPPAADGYRQGGGSRESQACRAETSS